MKAGREMDALVAEKVLGCKVEWNEYTDWAGKAHREPTCGCDGPHRHNCTEEYIDDLLHHYSDDIAAAWAVVAKLGRDRETNKAGWWLSLREKAGIHPSWVAEFVFGGMSVSPRPTYFAEAPTAPLAICLAALIVVEGKHG